MSPFNRRIPICWMVALLVISATARSAEPPLLRAGQFDQAFAACASPPSFWLEATTRQAYVDRPITVEAVARLDDASGYNIVVSCEPKESQRHWELYSFAGSGEFAALVSGAEPDVIRSGRSITDGKWHHLAMVLEPERVTLFVDGEQVTQSAIKPRPNRKPVDGPLLIGHAFARRNPGDAHGCRGLIDEVRISRGVRTVAPPDGPMAVDDATVALWRMDRLDGDAIADASEGNNDLRVVKLEGQSLDELDRKSFAAGPSPLDGPVVAVEVRERKPDHPAGPTSLVLDGVWQLAEGGEAADRISGDWPDAIQAAVPGSVHLALEQAGKIPDPKFGKNDAIAREKSFKTWWYRKQFPRPEGMDRPRLVFDGVAIRCTVWLNGRELGAHEGMFGGPEFELDDALADQNTLVVRIDPAPSVEGAGQPNDFFKGMNVGWLYTVVFNNVYGWHYSNIPALGIWRSVRIEGQPSVDLGSPLVATRDAAGGVVELAIDATGPAAGWRGRLVGTILAENFEGKPVGFEHPITSTGQRQPVRLRLNIPDPHPWWPNGVGDPNLYRLRLSFIPDSGVADHFETTFGLRTVEMRPLPSGPNPRLYNWTFVINGRPMFVKGTGWCTMDSSMDFSRERYARLIDLARLQHVQMLRAWGSGMPETDDFYDLCDRAGIMVMQEWPTAWNSHKEGWQPYEILEDTVRRNTLRLRNRPSLVMWGAGNESDEPFGKAIDMMGRLAIELDGTRPFHRGEPWGGSIHNYDCDWGRKPLDHALSLQSIFFGEFGMRSMPVYESVQRYLPEDERSLWPPTDDGSFAYHTPVFNQKEDMVRLKQFSGYFSAGTTMQDFILGSQLAATTAVRHTLERARTRWPECTGALYYKMNDNYPAASWACVDWYGAPKLTHFFFQQAFAPVHATVLFDTFDVAGKAVTWPVHVIDDADDLAGSSWQVTVRAYDRSLQLVKQQQFNGSGGVARGRKVGEFALDAGQTRSTPLLVHVAIARDGARVNDTFYWLNFEAAKDSLTLLPKTTLSLRPSDGAVTVANTGPLPAVGVHLSRPGHADTFEASEGYLWLEPGESRTIRVNTTDGVIVEAWND